MEEDFSKITRELRKESCPQRVIDAVSGRIAAEPPPPRRLLRYAIPVALAGVVLLSGLLVWRRPTGGNLPRQPERVQQKNQSSKSPAQAAQEAENALGLIGAVLLDAGERSKTIISDRAVVPLRRGAVRAPIISHI